MAFGSGWGIAGSRFAKAALAGVSFLAFDTALHVQPASAQSVAVQPAGTLNVSVPAGSLESGLLAFGRQVNLRMVYPSNLTSGKTTAGVSGRMTVEQALGRLLAGTGLNYRFTNATTVAISQPGAGSSGAAVADGSLVLDAIDVAARGSGPNADIPFETPGSVSYLSQQDIQRFSGNTAGDIFQGMPGVMSGTNRSGAAIDPNIRGMQGMGRVATTIDGSEQSTSSYRGYSGVSTRTYIDPDLISGVTVTKGPNAGSPGAIGGTVAIDTLNSSDILTPGDTYGVRLKVSAASNATAPQIGTTQMEHGQPSIFNLENKSGSAAFAVTQPNIDIVGAYVRRISGNYFAGTRGDLYTDDYRGGRRLMSKYGHGDEVFNTSQNSSSFLLKTTLRPADDHELQLGYMRYENAFGEVFPSWIAAGSTIRTAQQTRLATIALDQFTARYHWKPADNPLVDLKANASMSATDELSPFGGVNSSAGWSNRLGVGAKSKNYGADISNTSRFDVAAMPASLRYGGSIRLEDAVSDFRLSTGREIADNSIAPDGARQLGKLFVNGRLEPLPWLALDAGVTWLTYRVSNRARPDSSYTGPAFTGYEGSGFSPNFGVTVTPLEGWQLFAKYAAGIRPPSLRESTWNASGLQFNPDVVAEKASNWEFGTNFLRSDLFLSGDKARLKLAYFNNTTNDYLGRSWISTGPWAGYLAVLNYDKVVINGVELSGGYDAKKAFVDFGFNYYTKVQICRTAGVCNDSAYQSDYLANQIPPRYSVSLTGGLRFFDESLTLGGRYTYMAARAGRVLDDDYSRMLGVFTKAWNPYSVVDVFAQWKINDRLTLDLSAENLLDAYYVDAINNTDMPAPGRTIRATLTGKFGDSTPWPAGQLFNRSAGGVPGADWTGLYVGGHVGQGFAALKGTTTAMDGTPSLYSAAEATDMQLNNFLLGGQVGFNYQFDNRFVAGFEADFSKTRIQGFQEVLANETSYIAARNQLASKTIFAFNWMGTIRGRVGYAFDRFFVYGTAGLAFMKETDTRDQYKATNVSTTFLSGTATERSFEERTTADRRGWTIGAGTEYAVTSQWSIKGEYLYSHFGADDFRFPKATAGLASTATCTRYFANGSCRIWSLTGPPTNGRTASSSVDLHAIKMGVNYRF